MTKIALISCIALCMLSCGTKKSDTENDRDKESKTATITPKFREKIQSCSRVFDFHDGAAIVADEDYSFGLIDVDGNELVPCEYSGACNYRDGYFGFIKTDSEGVATVVFYNSDGKKYDKTFPLGQWYDGDSYAAALGIGAASAFADPYLGDRIGFCNGLCYIHTYNAELVIDSKGRKVQDADIKQAANKDDEMDDLSLFIEWGTDAEGNPIELKGYKNSKGEVVVPALYYVLGEFHNGLARAELCLKAPNPYGCAADMLGRSKDGYVDLHGNSTFPEEDINKIKNPKYKGKSLLQQ